MTSSVRHSFGKLFLLRHLVILTFPNVHYTEDEFNKAVKWIATFFNKNTNVRFNVFIFFAYICVNRH